MYCRLRQGAAVLSRWLARWCRQPHPSGVTARASVLAVELIAPGLPARQALALVQRPSPEPGPGEVRLRLLARPINPADLLLLDGRHLARPALPAAIGIEGAAVVDAQGPGATLSVGTLVAVPAGGTWREQLVCAETQLLPLPPDVPVEQAAMLAVNPFTALGLLRGLAPGSVVGLNAASSSLGRLLLVLGRRLGLRLVALVRSLHMQQELLDLGAEAVLKDGEDLAAQWRLLGLPPLQRALDAVAGDASARLFAQVAEGGELVVYGLLASERVQLPAAELVFRDVRVRGFSRLRVLQALPAAERLAMTEELVALLRDGVMTSTVAARYPLAAVVEAIEAHQRPGRRGKILLLSDP